MSLFIALAVVVALVIGLFLWTSRRTFRPGGSGHDVDGTARRTKLRAQDDATRWHAGS